MIKIILEWAFTVYAAMSGIAGIFRNDNSKRSCDILATIAYIMIVLAIHNWWK